MRLDLPCHHACDPLTLGECGVDGLARLVAQRTQACVVFATRLDDLRMHPRFGPDEKETALGLYAAPRVQVDIATSSEEQTGAQRGWRGQKRLLIGCVGCQDHGGGGITEQVHGGMECDGRRLDHCEASGKHLTQAVMDGKRAAILQDKMAKLGTGASLGTAE